MRTDPEVVIRAAGEIREIRYRFSPTEIARRLYGKGLLNPQITRSIDAEREVPIEALEVSVRLRNALARLGVRTAGDLESWTPADVLDVRNIGYKSLEELEDALWRRDLFLKDSRRVAKVREDES